ncbi:hypothetical protein PLANPX_3197 [Lacipirellula parvula]|uniref:Uncharacterized protein n=1 Tax=Lacipirellula parvula TaxID=2650471 RepID=A0A5K7XB24_9BACT|nr:hypothetical protein PLANPX_3197 [Lacipirellula parvula]
MIYPKNSDSFYGLYFPVTILQYARSLLFLRRAMLSIRRKIVGVPYSQTFVGKNGAAVAWTKAVVAQTADLPLVIRPCLMRVTFLLPPSKFATNPVGNDLDNLLKRFCDALVKTVSAKPKGKTVSSCRWRRRRPASSPTPKQAPNSNSFAGPQPSAQLVQHPMIGLDDWRQRAFTQHLLQIPLDRPRQRGQRHVVHAILERIFRARAN